MVQQTNLDLRSDCPQLLNPIPNEYLLNIYTPFVDALSKLQDSNPNIYLFDPLPILCPKHQCTVSNHKNELLYIDDDHLSRLGSQSLVEPFSLFLTSKNLVKILPLQTP